MARPRGTYFVPAIAQAIGEAMGEDESVIVFGEDVEISAFGSTKGLVEQFGQERVRNTPISEPTLVGAAIGAAATGLRPIVELMFSSFVYICMDQLGNQAARLRYMSGGQVNLPIVFVAGTGPSGSAAAQHSENPHSILMHLSGLKVVMPSTPADAKGLMLSAIADPNPVVYLFDLQLARQREEIPEQGGAIPLGSASVLREGSDLTVVALASLTHMALELAAELEAERGLSVEVIDPRSLVPFDWETVFTSVAKTGRLLVADPARPTCGAAAEIIARVTAECWSELEAAPRRVTWEDVPIPFAPILEEAVTVSKQDLRDAMLGCVDTVEA
jgi:pyruvate dehydrogenase E1 component beta subunit